MLRRLATTVVSHPRLVLLAALAALVVAGTLGAGVSARLKVGGFDDPGSESSAAQRILDENFGGSTPNLVLQVTARTGGVDTPEVAAAARRTTENIAAEPGVTRVAGYWSTGSPDLRGADGRSALVLLHVDGTPEQAAQATTRIVDRLPTDDPVVEVRAGGRLGLSEDIDRRVDSNLVLAESIALPTTLVLLVVAFGGVVAALMPLAVGIASILTTMLVLLGLARLTDVSVYALTVATAFGLGLAIDFGLLMVSRFREERAAGHEPRQAVIEAVATAGRTIAFSAATVTVAMTGLLVFPTYFLRSVGLAAIAVVAVAAVSAVVILPALLTLLGPRVDSVTVLRRRDTLTADSRFWRRTAAAVTRRPVRFGLPVVALLIVMCVPFLHAQFATPDERALPADSAARQVTTALRENYSGVSADAVTVVAADGRRSVEPLAARISAITGRLGLALAVMVAATFVLLFLFTGSVVLPLKALLLNVLVLAAVLGAMAWIFQDGHLSSLTGATPAPLNIAMTVLLCCISFSLSVDYEIFLLSRIKEARERGCDTCDAVVVGLGRVGRIVSSAAALLTVTLLSFATGLSFMQMFGIGTALAVLVDATLVRGVLVPGFMAVAGDLNWWAPRPLRRLHTRFGPSEAPTYMSSPRSSTVTEWVSAPTAR
ncbi:MMPL family transporter [Rhodococcus sp. NPDC059234]|uniref:MMPL family transporter n=1 Tax=Rhodococcus sp. NPDC059234 TaxID=3346781 RepID=UPI00366E1D08